MTLKYVKYFLILCFTFNVSGRLNCQVLENGNPFHKPDPNLQFSSASSFLPVSIGVGAVLYLVNPILIYESKKLYAGLTKEFSLGWGKLGQHRTSFEYSIIISGAIRHFIRFSYKYDFLLDNKIEPSHMLQGTSVVSVGGGYFNDFEGGGVFPELTYGFSLRNDKLLFYPHIKIRHTFMLSKAKPDITDISFGLIIGFANPFIDVNIRRKY